MVLKSLSRLIFIALLPLTVYAQKDNTRDSVKSYGNLSGEWRTYYMATINKDSLKDFNALATGGYIKYTHVFWNRLEFGGALYTSFNLNIQDLTIPDETTGRLSRYEAGQFDVTDLSDRAIFVLGELYGSYSWNSGKIKLGRMRMKTPFVNGQDGRMIPTMIQGIQLTQNINDNLSVIFGGYNAIAPRSTEGYFNIGESIGKYPIGRGLDGNPSGYRDNTKSDFMLIADINWRASDLFKLRVVDYFIENVFHAVYLKPSLSWMSGTRNFAVDAEWLFQHRVGDGGNSEDEFRYFVDKKANVFGIQLSTFKKARWRIAYNRITDDGRYLFPREWGREFLFSFQKRERSEGLRNAHSVLMGVSQPLELGKSVLNTEFTMGRHWNEEVSNAASNKYAMPDYMHFNLDLTFKTKKIPGLVPELLITHKMAREDVSENPNVVMNKVDLWHFSLIFNYRFN